METVLGIDLGTSGLKALLVDAQGQVRGAAQAGFPTRHPRPGWSEQDPEDWWRALREALARLARDRPRELAAVRAVGLTGQMHGAVLLDRRDRPVRPAILWNDSRSTAACDAVTRRLGLTALVARAGNRAFPGFTAPKIRWLRAHEPDTCRRTARLLLPKDYLRLRLTGTAATDVTDAAGTLLLDIPRRTWSEELCALWEVPPAWLPPVHESPAVTGAVRAGGDTAGLPPRLPVAAGAGDQAAAALGAGVVAEGRANLCLGTSGVVFAQTDAFRPDPEGVLHAFCHAVPGTWHLMGVMLSCGGALEWFARTLPPPGRPPGRVADLCAAAAGAPPGSGDVLFLPYLAGERCPHPDPAARGTLHGLTLAATYGEIARAVVEGVVAGLAACARRLERFAGPLRRLRATGGGARSPFLLGLLASALGRPVEAAPVDEGSAYGAALLAGVTAGWAPDVPSLSRRWERPGEVHEPRAPEAEAFRRLAARRESLYRRVRTTPPPPASGL